MNTMEYTIVIHQVVQCNKHVYEYSEDAAYIVLL